MADKQLFPVFETPEIIEENPAQEQKYKGSLDFDYDAGDFRQDGANRLVICDGREAYRQWCVKCACTQRGAHLAYRQDFGADLDEAFGQPDRSAVESALERAITEALMMDPRTEYVRGFAFTWEGNQVRCDFTVKGFEWEEQPVGVSLKR